MTAEAKAKAALQRGMERLGEDEEYEASAYGGFADYFRRKKIKLQNQDDNLRKRLKEDPNAAKDSTIFKGCVVTINGYTNPSIAEIHRMVVEHGGVYRQYMDGKTSITHIIASNLTPKKQDEFKNYKVVLPAWIVDSVKEGKLADWSKYRTIRPKGQKLLSSMTTGPTPSKTEIMVNAEKAEEVQLNDSTLENAQIESTEILAHNNQISTIDPSKDDLSTVNQIESELPSIDNLDDQILDRQSNNQIQDHGELEDPFTEKVETNVENEVQELHEEIVFDIDESRIFGGELKPIINEVIKSTLEKDINTLQKADLKDNDSSQHSKSNHSNEAIAVLSQPEKPSSQQITEFFSSQKKADDRNETPKTPQKTKTGSILSSLHSPSSEKPKRILEQDCPSITFSPNKKVDHTKEANEVEDKSIISKDKTAEEHVAELLKDARIRKSTTVDPDFLTSYYSNSRLHHLSKWKADIKAQLQEIAEASSQGLQRPSKADSHDRLIFHIDFDCFFAAVSINMEAEKENLRTQPVVVGYSGMNGEIASCNYVARSYGIKNGMWMKTAQELCPSIKCVPYQFEAYEAASKHFYQVIAAEQPDFLKAVSVDEVLIDMSKIVVDADSNEDKINEEACTIAERIRSRVRELTDCEVSVGIGSNILLAKIASRFAKPNGKYHLRGKEITTKLSDLEVQSLPGVGYSLASRLEASFHVKTVADLRAIDRGRLQKELGPKTGDRLWNNARGLDNQQVGEIVPRKSVSAEVNWGVRFANEGQVEDFMKNLSAELHRRMIAVNVKGKHLTLKVMQRARDAPLDPPKHLGHGKVELYSKSVLFKVASDSLDQITRESYVLLKAMNISPGELRGLGLQMTKLETLKPASQKTLRFADQKSNVQTKELFEDNSSNKPKAQLYEATQERLMPKFAFTVHDKRAKSPEKAPRTKSSLHTNLGTQYDIPSQVDQSVINALPPKIREKVLARAKIIDNGSEDRASNDKVGATQYLIPSQIDSDVLAALPKEVMNKIQGQLRTSSENDTGTKSAKATPVASLPSAYQNMKSSKKYDDKILNELPEDIRKEIIEDLKSVEMASIIPLKPQLTTLDNRAIFFVEIQERRKLSSLQNQQEIGKIKSIISKWVESTLKEGPSNEDVEEFGQFVGSIILDERDLSKAELTMKTLISLAGKVERWCSPMHHIVNIVNLACKDRRVGLLKCLT